MEIPEEQETITLDDSDEDQNKTIVLKEEIKRDSIQIIHEDPVSTVSFKCILILNEQALNLPQRLKKATILKKNIPMWRNFSKS